MAAFGTGINAALGRIDYTPYLQGASQGSAAIGRGIESLGQGISGAIKEYSQNKEMRDLLTQNNETQAQKALRMSDLFKSNPAIFNNEQPIPDKMLQDLKNMPNMSMGRLKAVNAELNAAITKYEPVIADYTNSMREAQAYKAATASPVLPSNAVSAYMAAGGRYPEKFAANQASTQNTQAETMLRLAQVRAAGQPKEKDFSTFDTINSNLVKAWIQDNPGEEPSAKVLADISKQASEIVTGKSVGQETQAATIPYYLKRGEELNTAAATASEALPNILSARQILAKGPSAVDTGFGAELKTKVRSIANAFGFPIDEQKMTNTQVLASTLGQNMLNIISKTKGSTSNKETAIYQAMSASIDKSPEAINDILDLTLAVTRNNIEADRAFKDSMDKYGDPQKATSAANAVKQKFNSDYLKKIDELSAKYEVPETQTKVNALNPSQPSFLSNRLKQANDRLDILNRGLIRTP
jgi:hypothetical protein